MRKIYGGSWTSGGSRPSATASSRCNCPHFHGLDGPKVEDLTFARDRGTAAHPRGAGVRARQHPRLQERVSIGHGVPDRHPADAAAPGRVRAHEGSIFGLAAVRRLHGRGRDYYMPYRSLLPMGVENPPLSRTPLSRRRRKPSGRAGDPAVPGHGAGRRYRRGARAREKVNPRLTKPCDGSRRSWSARERSWRRRVIPPVTFCRRRRAVAAPSRRARSTRSCRSTREPRSSIDRGPVDD